MFYLVLHHVGICTRAGYSVANVCRRLSAAADRLCMCVFPFLLFLLHYFLPHVPFCLSFIMARGRLEIKEASIGRQSEWSHSVMLSATHNALQVDAWHVLYIFPLRRSLNKCPLMYSSQEMNFYLYGLGTCSLSVPAFSLISWARGKTHTHTHSQRHTPSQTRMKSKNRDNKCGHKHAHHAHTCYVLPQGSWGCVCWYDRFLIGELVACAVKQWSKYDYSDIQYI